MVVVDHGEGLGHADFITVHGDQDIVIIMGNLFQVVGHLTDDILALAARNAVQNVIYLVKRFPDHPRTRPSAEPFGFLVVEGDITAGVGGDESVTDALDGDGKAVFSEASIWSSS